MNKSIVITKRVSFVNLIEQVEKYTEKFGKGSSVFVEVSHKRYGHQPASPEIEYVASFIYLGRVKIFKSENPLNLIEQIEAHLNNKPMDIIDVNI